MEGGDGMGARQPGMHGHGIAWHRIAWAAAYLSVGILHYVTDYLPRYVHLDTYATATVGIRENAVNGRPWLSLSLSLFSIPTYLA
ncbi:hypothetical protein LX32DRAFT_307853 [Colletotrichum zoysiae]|uniref:Uncharacterized protein n=1 Tax=Colletotrichum zoysiae TaxID=1216348 RepID=A0AAD9HTG3_9PEZI|nr:hypothetical protein LX32DRAFT_307853 [Colletotrichum zoysiae]